MILPMNETQMGGEHAEPDVEVVLKEINGYTVADRKQIKGIPDVKNDGSTACGAESATRLSIPRTARRAPPRRAPHSPRYEAGCPSEAFAFWANWVV